MDCGLAGGSLPTVYPMEHPAEVPSKLCTLPCSGEKCPEVPRRAACCSGGTSTWSTQIATLTSPPQTDVLPHSLYLTHSYTHPQTACHHVCNSIIFIFEMLFFQFYHMYFYQGQYLCNDYFKLNEKNSLLCVIAWDLIRTLARLLSG